MFNKNVLRNRFFTENNWLSIDNQLSTKYRDEVLLLRMGGF